MPKFAANQSSGSASLSSSSTRLPRIGELLVAAKIVKPEVLHESLQIAKTSKTLIGTTLISLGQLDEHKLQAALEIQNLIRNHLVGRELGTKALAIACSARITAEEALKQLGWQTEHQAETNQSSFVQLMLDSGLISQKILKLAEEQSKANNLPLGRCLVVNRYLTQNRLEAVLVAQSLIKDNQITEEQALKALKLSTQKREPLEYSLIQFGIQQLGESNKRILDLLHLAGIISEPGKLTVLETSLTQERPFIDVLIELEMVSFEVIDKAMNLQWQFLTGNLTLGQAANLLKLSQEKNLDLQALIAEVLEKGQTVNQVEQLLPLLKSAGILAQDNIEEARKAVKGSGKHIGEIILSQIEINPNHLEAAWQAQRMIDDKMISFEYASNAFAQINR